MQDTSPLKPWIARRAVGRTEQEVRRALAALSEPDLLRLQAIARLRCRGLPGLDWQELLHEAVLRALDGSRPWPPDVPMIAFLAGIMRSLRSDHWRRQRATAAALSAQAAEVADQVPDPERIAAATQALAAIDRMFADDPAAIAVILGLSQGLSAEEIRRRTGLSETEYDSTRKRMRRALLRHGLTGLP
ncbi:RNA polymerase sigma factor [Inquilinus sp. YAF38]|uniref:RNA polymerase sigma factor n=1 Tax=Inquilinus sp. YAF38 TaxID=3233084 RepID=UPI003F8F46EE